MDNAPSTHDRHPHPDTAPTGDAPTRSEHGPNPQPTTLPAGGSLLPPEQSAALQRALAHLPEDERSVLLLHHGQRLSFVEIAGRLNLSPDNTRYLWAHAVERIHADLGASLGSPAVPVNAPPPPGPHATR